MARSEMGQGTITGLAQLVAEELECDWSKVTTEYPTPGQSVARKRVWGDFSTGGSRGIRMSHEYVRKGGATAREMLKQAAADEWKVAVSEVTAANSVITHKASGRTTTYGKVAEKAAKLEPPKDVALKDRKDWKVAGKPLKRLDTVEKVTGKQIYGADLKLPGMLTAAIKESPVFGGKVNRSCRWARPASPWSPTPGGRPRPPSMRCRSSGTKGRMPRFRAPRSPSGSRPGSTRSRHSSAIAYPYQNHVCMEPMNATARYTADKCEVWVPTQDGETSFAAVLAASGLPAEKCEVYKINLGGGFGRRGAFQDYVHQAVNIAKQMPGTPVKLLWSREEDMVQGRYHPVMQCKLVGAFDKDNNLTGLHMRLSGQSILATVRPAIVEQQKGRDPLTFQGVADSGEHAFGYTIPNLLIDHAMRNPHVPPGFWRGVNINQNAIFIECFMDELAQAVGQDELEFRRKLMSKHPRNLGALNAVAERIGWGKPAPQGIYRGLAHMKAFNSYVAAAAEISVEGGGSKVKIHRIVGATDPGYAVNPAQIDRQVAGSFVYGLSGLFLQECTVKDGRIEQANFDTYDSMRIAQMPKVESIILETGGSEPWGGIGEPTICVAAPAVLNAYFKATGKRIRSYPLKNHNIQMV
jgi:isoquinoline 1-oxidoreductase beta subunit